MTVFQEYLEEAYSHTSLRNDQVKEFIMPFIKFIDELGLQDEEVLQLPCIPQAVKDYFETEFERCSVTACKEWNRKDEMHYGHNSNQGVCPSCKGV